jgi:hypothetical protein
MDWRRVLLSLIAALLFFTAERASAGKGAKCDHRNRWRRCQSLMGVNSTAADGPKLDETRLLSVSTTEQRRNASLRY